MRGEGRSYKERQPERGICLECRKEMAKGSLVAHLQTQHGGAKVRLGQEVNKESGGDKPRNYRTEFNTKAGLRPCPVEGCSDRALTRTKMRVHFWYRHVRDTMVILEEGNFPHPRCPLCDIMVPWRALNGTHCHTVQCKRGTQRKRRRLASEDERENTARSFSTYGRPMDMVTSFQYPGRVILAEDND